MKEEKHSERSGIYDPAFFEPRLLFCCLSYGLRQMIYCLASPFFRDRWRLLAEAHGQFIKECKDGSGLWISDSLPCLITPQADCLGKSMKMICLNEFMKKTCGNITGVTAGCEQEIVGYLGRTCVYSL